jgi:UDP-N-acetylmuramoyl-L-alanyl-D-glutamate--2,6-diaminopimelate ligase
MTLGELMQDAGCRHGLAAPLCDVPVAGLDYDSRRIEPGWVFFAFPGERADGRAFAGAALERGAVAVVSPAPPPQGFRGPWLEVAHGRAALALAARRFYAAPDEALRLTGVTGTNGKTTTVYAIDAMLRAAGLVTGMLGTIEYRLAGRCWPAVNTTPESLDLLRLLAGLREAGGSDCSLEVSSHALALKRVHGLRFHTAVFTNLTCDHLDFHGTMEAYFDAKCLLFAGAGAAPPAFAVLNADDPVSGRIPLDSSTVRYRYAIEAPAEFRALRIESGFDGLRFEIEGPGGAVRVDSPLAGRINVYNLLAAYAAGLSLGLEPAAAAAGLARCTAVPGRFERVVAGQPFLVVVDYAHTDDALRNVIAAARALEPRRVITLFGCGGDRDRAKRPLMGLAAGEASDLVVLTSDNPRSEDPLDIINDALVGLRRTDVPHIVEPDREAAIRRALAEAAAGDIVLLAGKGHETYQTIGGRQLEFDDRAVARRLLHELGYGGQAEEAPS